MSDNSKPSKSHFSSIRFGALAAVLTLTLSSCATIGTDKTIHFSVTGIISAMATCLADEKGAVLAGIATGMGAGLAKEAYDTMPNGSGFDGEDLIADAFGTGAGTLIGYALCHQAPPAKATVIDNDPATNQLIIDTLKLTNS